MVPSLDTSRELTEGHSQRIDAAQPEVSSGSFGDRQILRSELMRLIVKNEARRRMARIESGHQDTTTTDGLANSQVGTTSS